jgi:hypothetical protein
VTSAVATLNGRLNCASTTGPRPALRVERLADDREAGADDADVRCGDLRADRSRAAREREHGVDRALRVAAARVRLDARSA